jgi:hypothetical protein
MPEAAALLFPVVEDVGAAIGGALGFGGEAAAAAGVSPELAALYTAAEAPLPAAVGDIAAGTFEFAPAAAEAAGAAASGLGALTGTAADYVTGLAPGALTDAGLGSSVGTSAAAQGLTGTAAQYAGGLAGAAPSALTPALSSGLGSAASSAIPAFAQGSVLPLTEAATASDLSYLPIQTSAEGLPVTAGDATAGAGSLGSSGTSVGNALAGGTASPLTPLSGADPSVTSALQPTLNDASSSAEQTLGGQPGQEISKDLSRLGSPDVTNTAVDQAPVTTTAPAAPAAPAPAPAPAATPPVTTAPAETITPTTDALSSSGGTSTLVKGATDAGGDGLLGGVKSFMKDYGSLALGGAGLAYNMLKGNEPVPYSAQLESQAAQLQAQGAQLQGYLSSGTLPPGIGAALQGAHDSAAASIRAQYASRGMSGSSAEMQDLANLAQTTVSQGANIASSLLSTGVSEQQFASGLYQNLMAQSVAQDTAMSNAMAGFTNAMAGGYAKKAAPVG